MDTLSKLGLKYGTDKIGKHNYLPTGLVNEIGFLGINVQQNPDLFLATAMTPFKI